eukprot:m.77694 g.77694  ORF g.77694 m.77694 type:complete len:601 (+) comp36059_c0_seq1:249-2051(+)
MTGKSKRRGKKRNREVVLKKHKKTKRLKAQEETENKSNSPVETMDSKDESGIPRLETILSINEEEPLTQKHVQVLISQVLQPETGRETPHWCRIHNEKQLQRIVVVMMSYVSPKLHVNRSSFPFLTDVFSAFDLRSPGTQRFVYSGLEALLYTDEKKNEKKNEKKKKKSGGGGELDVAQNQRDEKSPPFGANQCLLNAKELIENGFPLSNAPMAMAGKSVRVSHEAEMEANDTTLAKSTGFIKLTKAKDCSSEAPMFAIDCEMCGTEEGPELTRISIVDQSLECVYDTLVKPDNPIIDYKTKFSGITAESLEHVTKTLEDVQREVQAILPADCILIGHSLENDLLALKLIHDRVIDTTILYTTADGRKHYKPSLRYLSRTHLRLNIQTGSGGHSSIEDAQASMELVLLKLQRGPEFGLPVKEKTSHSFFSTLATSGKHVTFVDSPSLCKRFCSADTVNSVPCTDDDEALKKSSKCTERTDVLWVHFHDVERELKRQHYGAGKDESALSGVLKKTDTRLNLLFSSLPAGTMCLVIAGSGDLHQVQCLQKDSPAKEHLLNAAVMKARMGKLYIAIKQDGNDSSVQGKEVVTMHSVNGTTALN